MKYNKYVLFAITILFFLIDSASQQVMHTTTLWSYFECVDGDGGINPYVKSYVYSNHSVSKFNAETLKVGYSDFSGILNDSCLDKDTVWEYFCEGSKHSYTSVNCTYGCTDGACIKPETKNNASTLESTRHDSAFMAFIKKIKSLFSRILAKMGLT